jgi:hypothetical protein
VETLHAVYRCALDNACPWRGYVVGSDTTIEACALPQARAELEQRLLAELTSWPRQGLSEHTEHALGKGLWVREAMDDRVLDRAYTTRVVLEALDDQRLRTRLAHLPETRAGGLVVLACVPGDTLAWIRDQHDGHGTLIVATAVTNHRLWWNALTPAGQEHTTDLPLAGNLADFDLTDPQALIDDWMAATACGRLLTLTPTPDRHSA